MAVVYSIRDWDEHFEVSQSRKIDGPMNWVALPTKHDGKGFRRIMLLNDGLEIYGAWVLLVQMAAKCPRRGILADKDGPLTEADFHVKTGAPQSLFTKALAVLSSRQIGWIIGEQWEHAGSTLPTHNRTNKPTEPTNQPPYPPKPIHAAPTAADDGGRAGGLARDDSGDGPRKPRSADAPESSPPRFGWGAVADRLAGLGASRWREAISEAKQCGCSADLALQIIDHGTSKGFQVGAIICRLSKARPTLPIADGWPLLESPEATRRRTATSRAEREREDEEAYRDEAEKSQLNAAAREQRYGPELDQMPPEEVAEICRPFPTMAKMLRKGDKSNLLREWLLVQLERRATA